MTVDKKDRDVFSEYMEPLMSLEAAYNLAKLPVKFRLFVAPLENPMVEIIYGNKKSGGIVCITGDSPAQAVKDVAAAVKL